MDYKLNNLKDKIYRDFITGQFGEPKIPSENEVLNKLQEMTTTDYVPMLDNKRLSDVSLSGITSKFSNIIDDIGILFDSIEDESRDLLDQLTNSLKEHNGVKRELKRIKTSAEDIINGKLGEEYLQYNFTESFDDVNNINLIRSDPIDTDGGIFTIMDNSSRLVNMNHYINRKIEFNVIETAAPVLEQGFVGEADAESILSKDDPRSITYRIKTSRPTRLVVATAFQLRPNGEPVNINSVGISVDASLMKGYIRLYYQNGYQWKNVPGLNVQEIKADNVVFNFDAVDATHVKIEFIKDIPDTPTTNEYYYTIYEVAIAKSSTKGSACLYSKPITLTKYDIENPVINNISCIVDADIPSTCKLKVSVAQDIKISGQFVNSLNEPVYPDSIDAVDFNPYATGFVFLSDIMERYDLSGVIPYRGFDFNWKELKPARSFGNQVPEVIEFNNTTKHPPILNTIFNSDGTIKFGDRSYHGPWPENESYTEIYLSGWCNSDNPAWETFLKELVASGLLISGIDLSALVGGWSGIADYGDGYTTYESGINPIILNSPYWSGQWLGYGSGYPYNYYNADFDRVIRYGDYVAAKNGWWRPYAFTVTPTGIEDTYATNGFLKNELETSLPDFYFNGMEFYKIYKFSRSRDVIDSSIKLYQYEERPVASDNDNYSHGFRWKYKTVWSTETMTLTDQRDATKSSPDATFSGYFIKFPALNSNEEYSILDVLQVKQFNSNFVLSPKDYVVKLTPSGTIDGILLTPLTYNYPALKPENMSFDIKYNYRIKNKYLSTWTSFAIVSPGIKPVVIIPNYTVYGKNDKIIKNVVIEDLDNGTSTVVSDTEGQLKLLFDTTNSKTERHFKVTIFCLADESTGFSPRITNTERFVPKETMMTIPGGIKFVPRLEPLKICSLSSLIYDTGIGNDKKCALIKDLTGEKYLVIKKPHYSNFPGYYYNNISASFVVDYSNQIPNKGHYIRETIVSGVHKTFTTGSSGTIVYDSTGSKDSSWNDGQTLNVYPNSDLTTYYDLHSTYGFRINLDSSSGIFRGTLRSGDIDQRAPGKLEARVGTPEWAEWLSSYNPAQYNSYLSTGSYTVSPIRVPNRGFLFYNTAENLPAVYSISYSTISSYDDLANRFLYKIELESDGSRQVVPKVRSIRFEINKRPQ